MSRRESVATIIEDADVPASRLEEWKAAEDARLDAGHAREVRILDVVHEVAKDAPDDVFLREGIIAPLLAEVSRHARSDERAVAEVKRQRHRERRDPDARFADELEALRAWCEAPYQNRPGDSGRTYERGKLGSTIQSSSRPREPAIDEYLEAVRRALGTIDPQHVDMLVAAYVELAPPRVRTNKEGKLRDPNGETVFVDGRDPRAEPGETDGGHGDRIGVPAKGIGLGFGGEASASAISIARSTADQPGAQTWPEIVAERFGMLGENAAADVAKIVRTAKRTLRDELRQVELDGRPRFVIPPLSRREIDRERAREAPRAMVACCFGAPVINGVRLDCEHGERPEADTLAWPRCETCGKPRAS